MLCRQTWQVSISGPCQVRTAPHRDVLHANACASVRAQATTGLFNQFNSQSLQSAKSLSYPPPKTSTMKAHLSAVRVVALYIYLQLSCSRGTSDYLGKLPVSSVPSYSAPQPRPIPIASPNFDGLQRAQPGHKRSSKVAGRSKPDLSQMADVELHANPCQCGCSRSTVCEAQLMVDSLGVRLQQRQVCLPRKMSPASRRSDSSEAHGVFAMLRLRGPAVQAACWQKQRCNVRRD